MLTPDQLSFYRENGFVVLDSAFDDSELEHLRIAADELLD